MLHRCILPCLLMTVYTPCATTAGAEEPLLPVVGAAVDGAGLLIEIFTSEGCSSCPPVDALLNRLVTEAEAKQLPVYGIAWHVDYWNKLKTKHGVWVDPFSARWATERQARYAQVVPRKPAWKGKLITPDIVIDGGRPDGDASLQDFFGQRLQMAKPVTLTPIVERDGDDLIVTVATAGAAAGDHGHAVLLQRAAMQAVTAGENHGKSLQHRNVVRAHGQTTLTGPDDDWQLRLALPEGLEEVDTFVLTWVQEADALGIRGLAPAALPRAGTGEPEAELPAGDADLLFGQGPVCGPAGCDEALSAHP